jgi:hypothetical protein
MKKLGVVLAIFAIVALVGCGSGTTGGATASGGGGGAEPFKVDLSTLPLVKNDKAFSKAWDDLLINLPASSLPSDFSKYTRFTITAKYFEASGAEIEQGDSNCIVSMIYDLNGDIRGPANGPGANTPVKEFNVGGFSGLIHKDRGIRVTFSQAPQAVLFQNNSGSKVAFIELTSMVFHNGNYKSE